MLYFMPAKIPCQIHREPQRKRLDSLTSAPAQHRLWIFPAMSDYTIDPKLFNSLWDFSVSRMCGLGMEISLYGILLVLLPIAAYLLFRRAGVGRNIFIAATTAMAVLATLQLVVHIFSTAFALAASVLPSRARAAKLCDDLYPAGDMILVANKRAARSLLVVLFGDPQRFGRTTLPPVGTIPAALVDSDCHNGDIICTGSGGAEEHLDYDEDAPAATAFIVAHV
ncbi:hypothetical protein C8R46DRAFT_1196746 [Mycena filopes]|nr:hypothetical protein C8R46DRAFT_1196746 [Mycena filopes]